MSFAPPGSYSPHHGHDFRDLTRLLLVTSVGRSDRRLIDQHETSRSILNKVSAVRVPRFVSDQLVVNSSSGRIGTSECRPPISRRIPISEPSEAIGRSRSRNSRAPPDAASSTASTATVRASPRSSNSVINTSAARRSPIGSMASTTDRGNLPLSLLPCGRRSHRPSCGEHGPLFQSISPAGADLRQRVRALSL